MVPKFISVKEGILSPKSSDILQEYVYVLRSAGKLENSVKDGYGGWPNRKGVGLRRREK